MRVSFRGAHFAKEIILTCVRWYVAYPLSYRRLEEMLQERGVIVDHSTINRWVLKYSPQLEETSHRRKRPVYGSWRMDETYIRIRGHWCYLYGAVDKAGQTIDFQGRASVVSSEKLRQIRLCAHGALSLAQGKV
jgi:transposase-like protein